MMHLPTILAPTRNWSKTSTFVLLLASVAASATATDRIRTHGGSVAGEITGSTPLEITLDKGSAGTSKIPLNQVRSVLFDGEPPELTQARLNAKNGGYTTAIERLGAIDLSSVKRDAIREDVEFYLALCTAKNALGGQGDITQAGRELNDFVRRHPQNFHYLEAVETMGDLLMASGKFAAAQKQYAELAKSPWPDYQMRAAVLIGRTLQAQGKHPEAIEEFDEVLANSDTSDTAREQKLSATLAKAVSLSETGHLDDAVHVIEQMIQDTDPEQKELQARAYNALGECYERAGRTKDALLAFLHVDVLYSTVPDAHAEALSHLAKLWESIGQEARAREARQLLNEKYGHSRWAK
jgi:tetratricopeptide (TPR) repeat protein